MTTKYLRYAGQVYRRMRSASVWEDEGFVRSVDGTARYWGSSGSGLLLTTGEKIFLMLRRGVEESGTWGIPGGAVPVNYKTKEKMDAFESAKKETEEEAGALPPHRVVDKFVFTGKPVPQPDGTVDNFTYTTFIALVDPDIADSDGFETNWESEKFAWFSKEEAKDLPLHPGVKALLAAGKGFGYGHSSKSEPKPELAEQAKDLPAGQQGFKFGAVKYRGRLYRLAGNQTSEERKEAPREKKQFHHPTGGPLISTEMMAALHAQPHKEQDAFIAAIAPDMVKKCIEQYTNAENWCVAINGKLLSIWRDQPSALAAAKSWLISMESYAPMLPPRKP